MRMLMPDVIFIPRTAVQAQDLDLPPVNGSYHSGQEIGKEGYLFYNVTNKKEIGKTFSLQIKLARNRAHLSSF
jgi:hypothetical protein